MGQSAIPAFKRVGGGSRTESARQPRPVTRRASPVTTLPAARNGAESIRVMRMTGSVSPGRPQNHGKLGPRQRALLNHSGARALPTRQRAVEAKVRPLSSPRRRRRSGGSLGPAVSAAALTPVGLGRGSREADGPCGHKPPASRDGRANQGPPAPALTRPSRAAPLLSYHPTPRTAMGQPAQLPFNPLRHQTPAGRRGTVRFRGLTIEKTAGWLAAQKPRNSEKGD